MKRKPDALEIIIGLTIVTALALLFFSRNQSSSLGVAIIDLDEIGRRLGRDVIMNQAVQHRQATLQAELQQVGTMLQETFKAKRQECVDTPTEAQANELLELKRQLDAAIAQRKLQAHQTLEAFRLQLNREFLDEVTPVASRVAVNHGAKIIVLDRPSVLLIADPSVDITEQVLVELEGRTSKLDGDHPAAPAAEPADGDQRDPLELSPLELETSEFDLPAVDDPATRRP